MPEKAPDTPIEEGTRAQVTQWSACPLTACSSSIYTTDINALNEPVIDAANESQVESSDGENEELFTFTASIILIPRITARLLSSLIKSLLHLRGQIPW
jgi:hypothetical protein